MCRDDQGRRASSHEGRYAHAEDGQFLFAWHSDERNDEKSCSPINSAAARDAERAEYLDVRMRMEGCDEPSIGRALLLVAELHGMSRVAQACGVSVVTLRRQLNGTGNISFR